MPPRTSRKTRPDLQRNDVLIAGGGPAGLAAAIALAKRGLATALADAAAPKAKPAADNRAFFVSYGCWRIFRALGVEPALLPDATPVQRIEAEGGGGGIAFFAEDSEHEPVLGYVIEAGKLNAALLEAAKAAGAKIIAPARVEGATFGNPDAVVSFGAGEARAGLVIACDGAKSAVRQAAGLSFEGWDYPTKAISADLALDRPHEGAARQTFLASGPMAVLPLQGDRGSLVWTVPAAVAEALMAMSDRDFEAELAKQARGFLDGAKLAGPRITFPMGQRVADKFHGPRVALAGDAAHLVHPLAGQGLNLGLKDVAALVDVIAEADRVGLDIGSEAALAPYTRWRRADVVTTAAAMEGFARTFAGPAPIRAAAGLAMKVAGLSREARKLFAREAGGDLGALPTLMRA